MKDNVQLLIFWLDDRSYGVRLSQVMRVVHAVDFTPLPEAPDIVLGVIDFHGQIIPLLNIRRRFGLPEREVGIGDHFVVAAIATRTVAIVVDGVKEIVERPVEDTVSVEGIVPGLGRIEGVIQFEEGLTLIHDLDRFLSLDEERALTEAMMMEPSHG